MEVLFIHEPETSICLQTAMLVSLLKDGCEKCVCISPKFTPFLSVPYCNPPSYGTGMSCVLFVRYFLFFGWKTCPTNAPPKIIM